MVRSKASPRALTLSRLGYEDPSAAPALDTDAHLLFARQLGDKQDAFEVTLDGGRWRIRRFDRTATGWEIAEAAGEGGLERALAFEPALLTLPPHGSARWLTHPQDLADATFLDHLRVETEHVRGPVLKLDRDDRSEEMSDRMLEHNCLRANAYVNDNTVVVVRVAGPRGKVAVPVLVDEGEDEVVPRDLLVEHTWSSDSGGGPTSWDGGHRLVRINGPLGAVQPFGDDRSEDWKFVYLPTSPTRLARLVSNEIESWGVEREAALAFEPFDPKGTLTPRQRERWGDLFGAVEADLFVTLDDDTHDALRRRLARTSACYVKTRAALRYPNGKHGRALRSSLTAR